MPWSKVPMKDAHGVRYALGSCHEALIQRFPNKVTTPIYWGPRTEYIGVEEGTRRTEISK